jgi:regulation of enolase protein 1 (concanavalin A-like superfamily)
LLAPGGCPALRSRVVNLDLHALEKLHEPVAAHVADELLELVAGPRTDIFRPPDGRPPTLNAPALLAKLPDPDFVLSARVEAELRATFDAGALLVWQDDRSWAKLALEFSPEGRPTVVTVVNRGDRSDDCNSLILDQPSAHLRVARINDSFAFHLEVASRWHLIRHFFLDPSHVRVGFSAQSPNGPGCTARFREIRAERRRLTDVRDGT